MKSILITGAASGIGAATAKKLASKKVSLTLTTKNNLEGLKSVIQDVENCLNDELDKGRSLKNFL